MKGRWYTGVPSDVIKTFTFIEIESSHTWGNRLGRPADTLVRESWIGTVRADLEYLGN